LRAHEESTQASHHRHAETVRHSLRDGVTAYTCSPRCAGLVSHRRPGKQNPPKRDLSVGRSGPHDFTVRAQLPLACGTGASIASCSNVRGDWPNAPPGRIRMQRDNHTFRKNGRGILAGGARRPNRFEGPDEVGLLPQVGRARIAPRRPTSPATADDQTSIRA